MIDLMDRQPLLHKFIEYSRPPHGIRTVKVHNLPSTSVEIKTYVSYLWVRAGDEQFSFGCASLCYNP